MYAVGSNSLETTYILFELLILIFQSTAVQQCIQDCKAVLLFVERCQNVGICVAPSYDFHCVTIHQNKKRCFRLNNIIFCRVEEPENNIHHDQEGSCWTNFTNFFKNVKYNILGVTVKATIVWAIFYVIAIIINYVGDSYTSSCANGKLF